MISIIKNISKVTLAVIAFSLVMTSCKKDNSSNVKPLSVQNTKADVDPISTITVTGNYGNPLPAPGVYGTKYVNIYTGQQDSTGTNNATYAYNLLFTGTNNGVVGAYSDWTFKYLITTAALADISLDDYDDAAVPSAAWGQNTSTTSTPNGWWNYSSTTHQASPVTNVVMFAHKGTVTYAFKCTAIAGQGGATSNRAVYTFQSGIVD